MRQRFYYYVAEFLGRCPPSRIAQGILKCIPGIFAQRTGGSLYILFCKHIGYVLRNQMILRHLVGFQPKAHAIFLSHGIHIAHARDALQGWLHVKLQPVGDESPVVFGIVVSK